MNEILMRPRVFSQWPWTPILISMVLTAAGVALLLLSDLPPETEPRAYISLFAVILTLYIALNGAWSRWRIRDYERLSEIVSDMVTAWKEMDAVTGIAVALWENMRILRKAGENQKASHKSVERALTDLLTLRVTERPATHREYVWWRNRRY